jgi:uncharacterized membrane protein
MHRGVPIRDAGFKSGTVHASLRKARAELFRAPLHCYIEHPPRITANAGERKQLAGENLMSNLATGVGRLGMLAAMACVAIPAHAIHYDIATLSRPGAFTTQLFDVNDSGQMVGWSTASAGAGGEAFIYSGGMFTALTGPMGAISTVATGISDAGVVVGSYSTTATTDAGGNVIFGPQQSFIYDGGTYTPFAVGGATNTLARAISPDGRYVSGYFDSDMVLGQGFLLDTLTDMLTLVGGGGLESFTIAQGINSGYIMVGSDILLSSSPPTGPGFLYDIGTGTRTDVILPGSARTAFRAIDDNGIVSGWYRTAGINRGFTGYPGSVQSIEVMGAEGTFVEGSNNGRVLVGNFVLGASGGAFIATPVPEPLTAALLGLGLVGIVSVRHRASPRGP